MLGLVPIGLRQVVLGLSDRRAEPVESSLGGEKPSVGVGVVELHEHVARLDNVTFLDVDGDDPPEDLGADIRLLDRLDDTGRGDLANDPAARRRFDPHLDRWFLDDPPVDHDRPGIMVDFGDGHGGQEGAEKSEPCDEPKHSLLPRVDLALVATRHQR